jgi:hypothetical protein
VITLQHAPPSQVVLQVLGGNPMKASHPLLEAAVVGVDVLNVERPIDDPNALLDIDGSMGQAKGACHRLIHPRAIGAKNGILIHQGAQHGRDVGRVDTFEPKVSRLSAALAYHQDSNMLPVRAYPAAFACRSMQLAFALEGFQEESLVGFDNPSLVRGAVRGRSLKKAMAVRPAWAHSCGCKSRRKLITANEVKRNCMRVTECGEEAWSETASR